MLTIASVPVGMRMPTENAFGFIEDGNDVESEINDCRGGSWGGDFVYCASLFGLHRASSAAFDRERRSSCGEPPKGDRGVVHFVVEFLSCCSARAVVFFGGPFRAVPRDSVGKGKISWDF